MSTRRMQKLPVETVLKLMMSIFWEQISEGLALKTQFSHIQVTSKTKTEEWTKENMENDTQML